MKQETADELNAIVGDILDDIRTGKLSHAQAEDLRSFLTAGPGLCALCGNPATSINFFHPSHGFSCAVWPGIALYQICGTCIELDNFTDLIEQQMRRDFQVH